jgi:hypothetical protein
MEFWFHQFAELMHVENLLSLEYFNEERTDFLK